MKRFFIIFMVVFSLLLILVGGFAYRFDINEHSQWISGQIEQSTGYQVHFAHLERRGWQAPHFSISGLSVGLNNKQLLYIDTVNITISEFDLWQRQLDIDLVELSNIKVVGEIDALQKSLAGSTQESADSQPLQILPWSTLRINKLRIASLNVDISHWSQSLRLEQASLSADNLVIIKDRKLATDLLTGNLQFGAQALDLQLANAQVITAHDFILKAHYDLPALQATLDADIKQFSLPVAKHRALPVENVLLSLQLDKNRLSFSHLSANTFSGEVQAQAEALLAIEPSLPPAFSIEQLTVLSLRIKDMQLVIPDFIVAASHDEMDSHSKKQKLPINTLLLKQIDLQNVSVTSEEKQLPLTIDGLNARVQDVYLIQDQQFIDLSQMDKQTGRYTLSGDFLQWADSVSKHFSITGNFPEK